MLLRILGVGVAVLLLFVPGAAENKVARPIHQLEHLDWASDLTCQTVFFAVLEGLYTDGVPNDVVERILDVDPKTKAPHFDTHFVYCCPLCHPAYEAFELYYRRGYFYGRKDARNTLGPGLEPSLVKKLKSNNVKHRLEAIHTLIKRWVAVRLDTMRLTTKEKDDWGERFAVRRKLGMELLEKSNFAGKNSGYKGCAICDGSADACPLK